jgi:hypothetical protein
VIRVGIVVTNRDLRDASELAEHSQQLTTRADLRAGVAWATHPR